MKKKAQVTIFIILAIVLVIAIALFFLLRNTKVIEIFEPSITTPEMYIEKCVKDNVKQALSIILPQGGYISPELYREYKGTKIAYLCYNKNFYEPCINQNPLYLENIQNEIENYISPKIEDCFYSLKQDYERKNYNVQESLGLYKISLFPGQIVVDIDKQFNINKNEEKRNYDKFRVRMSSSAYDLASIAGEIVNQEVKFCYFEYLGYSLLYPKFIIDKTELNGEAKIYTITDKTNNEKMNLAVKSCSIPGGFG